MSYVKEQQVTWCAKNKMQCVYQRVPKNTKEYQIIPKSTKGYQRRLSKSTARWFRCQRALDKTSNTNLQITRFVKKYPVMCTKLQPSDVAARQIWIKLTQSKEIIFHHTLHFSPSFTKQIIYIRKFHKTCLYTKKCENTWPEIFGLKQSKQNHHVFNRGVLKITAHWSECQRASEEINLM